MRIGIDLGGTKIEAVALSPAGEEIARRRVTTPPDYVALLDAIAALVRELDGPAHEAGTVGVGIPGTLVPRTGLVKNANSVWLNGRPLSQTELAFFTSPVRGTSVPGMPTPTVPASWAGPSSSRTSAAMASSNAT